MTQSPLQLVKERFKDGDFKESLGRHGTPRLVEILGSAKKHSK